MARIVMKFGGTSVADIECLRDVADRVAASAKAGDEIAVVLSAMAGNTNQLIDWTRELCSLHDAREYDVVVSAGEQITIGLLAMALQERGVAARSWLGWQIPIQTDGVHSSARIEDIKGAEVIRRMGEGEVAVIAGFQGISPNNRVTTLGRGGSDITAVGLASALNANRCDIYTDVDGVYTADPRIVTAAKKLDKITYEEMLEMASQGARVLQTRSVELAMNHRVRLQVLSSFNNSPGTLVVDEDEIVEQAVVSGITYASDEAKVTLLRVLDRPGVAAAIFGPLADGELQYNDKVFEPLWSLVEEVNLPITFHVSTGRDPRAVGGNGGALINYVSHSMSTVMDPLVHLISSGVFERHPRIKAGSIEGGIGWVPWMIETLDYAHKAHHMWARPVLPEPPSFYYRRNCFSAFMNDRSTLLLAEELDLTRNFTWSNDYPHHEGSWPHSAASIERQMDSLSESGRENILGLNAAKIFGLSVPSR